ncbi:hypothetical protein HAX54_050399, partial [Datura stramonium]|nr:hypothetical protein [Datura stramonium]
TNFLPLVYLHPQRIHLLFISRTALLNFQTTKPPKNCVDGMLSCEEWRCLAWLIKHYVAAMHANLRRPLAGGETGLSAKGEIGVSPNFSVLLSRQQRKLIRIGNGIEVPTYRVFSELLNYDIPHINMNSGHDACWQEHASMGMAVCVFEWFQDGDLLHAVALRGEAVEPYSPHLLPALNLTFR